MIPSTSTNPGPMIDDPRKWIPLGSRIRLSLRGLMLVAAFVGAGLGYFVHCAGEQARAVSIIERSGGTVWYKRDDYLHIETHGGAVMNRPGPAPTLVELVLGFIRGQSVGRILRVHLRSGDPNALMEQVGKLSDMEFLDFEYPSNPLSAQSFSASAV